MWALAFTRGACGCPHLPAFHRTASSCEQQFETHSSVRPRLHVHLCCLVTAGVYHLLSKRCTIEVCCQCPLMAYDGFLMHSNGDPELFYDDGSDVEGSDAMTFAMMCTSSSLCNSCLWLRRCQSGSCSKPLTMQQTEALKCLLEPKGIDTVSATMNNEL